VSQWLSQQSVFWVQVSPVGLHDEAGTSHLPFTQLSEQQSVFPEHGCAYERHVAQLTPGKQAVPKQQPFAQDWALHTQEPPMHSWPAAHGGPPPQLQVPFVHPSATVALHEVQALP
jgi:hypothetical protein